jgi:hypothetical protein
VVQKRDGLFIEVAELGHNSSWRVPNPVHSIESHKHFPPFDFAAYGTGFGFQMTLCENYASGNERF